MEKIFKHILDDDEQIVKIMKPSKFKMFVSSVLGSMLYLAIFLVMGIVFCLVPDEGMSPTPELVWIPIVIYLGIVFIVFLFTLIHYKNIYYAYTNKRVIIRSGIFGVDFHTLDMGMIGAVNVHVSLLDKILMKNTGTLTFGSTASPVVASNGGASYKFLHIFAPYETCKEIKSFIDTYKKTLLK